MTARRLTLSSLLLVCLLSPTLSQTKNSIRFQEGAAAAGLDFRHTSGSSKKEFILESMSGGVALFDADGDGWLDIYMVNGGQLEDVKAGRRAVRNHLYRNQGNGTFVDITNKAGVAGGIWDMGATVSDIDNDGDLDLFVTGFRQSTLYVNDGTGVFQDRTGEAGLSDKQWSTGAAFGDYDGDGFVDLAVSRYVVFDPENPPQKTALCNYRGIEIQCGPRGLPGVQDSLYRNLGDGRFRDVTTEVGMDTGNRYFGLGVLWTDLDDDADLDLFVANDSCPNFLFINESGKFRDAAMEWGVALNEDGNEQAGMGVDSADVDGDGLVDLIQTNFSDDKNTLYLNQSGYFEDGSYPWGLGEISWQYLGWGTFFFDADSDGWLDLFVANGHVYPQVDEYQIGTRYKQREFLFRNVKGARFEEVGGASGFDEVLTSRGAAVGDLNNDGQPDIVVNRMDGSAGLYWNRTPRTGSWIGLDLRGTSGAPVPGTRVTLQTATRSQVLEVKAGSSYLSSSDMRLLFGLGGETVKSIEVRWSRGKVESLASWGVNQYNKIVKGRQVSVQSISAASLLAQAIEAAVPRLRAISEAQATMRPEPGKWCPKEILGHLVDSASNNHRRAPDSGRFNQLMTGGLGGRPWALFQGENRPLSPATVSASRVAVAWQGDYAASRSFTGVSQAVLGAPGG